MVFLLNGTKDLQSTDRTCGTDQPQLSPPAQRGVADPRRGRGVADPRASMALELEDLGDDLRARVVQLGGERELVLRLRAVSSAWRALVAQPHVLLACTGCARAVISIGHTPRARTWARILGAGCTILAIESARTRPDLDIDENGIETRGEYDDTELFWDEEKLALLQECSAHTPNVQQLRICHILQQADEEPPSYHDCSPLLQILQGFTLLTSIDTSIFTKRLILSEGVVPVVNSALARNRKEPFLLAAQHELAEALPRLEKVGLSGLGSGLPLSSWQQFPCLTELSWHDGDQHGEGLDLGQLVDTLLACSKLRTLDLSLHYVHLHGFGDLSPLPRLKAAKVKLDKLCLLAEPVDLSMGAAFVEALPSLTELDMWGTWVAEGSLSDIVHACPQLKKLSLGAEEGEFAGDGGFDSFMAACCAQPIVLQELKVGNVESMTDASLFLISVHLARTLTKLELAYVNIGTEGITAAAVLDMIEACGELVSLVLEERSIPAVPEEDSLFPGTPVHNAIRKTLLPGDWVQKSSSVGHVPWPHWHA